MLIQRKIIKFQDNGGVGNKKFLLYRRKLNAESDLDNIIASYFFAELNVLKINFYRGKMFEGQMFLYFCLK